MNAVANNEGFGCEAASFLLVGTILRNMPDQRWFDELVSDRVFMDIPYALNQDETVEGRSLMVGWTQAYDENSFGAVYADYMNLFIGPGKPLAPPWESIYDCSDEGLVFQRGTLEVRKAYLSFGLQIEEMHHEPDDHIGYELEFVSRLSRLTAEALQRGDVKEAERVLFEQTNFLEKHVFSWVFDWCELVCAHATTDFYRGIAMLIRGFLREAGSVRDVGLPEKALTL